MARLILTELASGDEAFILRDLRETAGLPTALKFRTGFMATYRRIADHPLSGAPRPALGAGIRIGIVWPYIVIYRYAQDDTVTVLRVVHGRRRVSGRLLIEKPAG